MSKADVALERKQQIVQATVECITKHGYHNFSMQDVARTAGVSKGIIHYYFLNKDELMMSVLDQVSSGIESGLAARMQAQEDAAKKLEIFIELCFNVVRTTREWYQVNMDFWTQINQKDEIRRTIANHYAKFRETAARIIEEGVKAKVFRPVDSKNHASYIISVIDGLSLQWLFDEGAFDLEKISKMSSEVIIGGLKISK